MVMGKHDGPLVPLINLSKIGLGGAHGLGNQYVSWIGESDFLNVIDFIISNDNVVGELNVCSPNPIPNKEFMSCIRKAYDKSFGLNLRPWMLSIGAFFMQTETELVTKSRRVVPQKLLGNGYRFKSPEFDDYIYKVARNK